MALFKRKDRSPYRHIGMALVPPAAFTAVPHSPPPTPRSKKKKKKVITSPVIPAILSATATIRAVSLGVADNELNKLKVSFEPVHRRPSQADFIDEDDTYARIMHHGSAPQLPSRVSTPRDFRNAVSSEDEESLRSQQPRTSRFRETTTTADVYAVPIKKSERQKEGQRKAKLQPKQVKQKRNKPKDTESLVDPVTAYTTQAPQRNFSAPSTRYDDVDGRPVTPTTNDGNAKDEVLIRQCELEERMRLKDEQTREMVLQLIQGSKTPSPAQTKKAPSKQKQLSPQRLEEDDVIPSDERSRYQEDHDLIKEIAALLKAQSLSGAEGVVLKQQIQDIIDENETLRETVERLNIELSRFQAKFGLNPDELDKAKGLPANGPKPKWLTDSKYLSPLLASYDKQLDMKDEVIAIHEEKFAELSVQIEDILKENEILRKASKQARCQPFISQQKWDNIKEQNNLMVEEIQIQLEQLELMERKIKDMHLNHVDEVARLSKRLALTDAECEEAQKARKQLKEDLNSLTEKFDKLVVECGEKIPAQEFSRAVAQCKSEMEDIKERHITELKEIMGKFKETQKEKNEALLEISKINVTNIQLKGEIDTIQKSRILLQEQIENLSEDLESAEQRELECQLHLANVMKVAERASSERATYAAVAEKEQLASQHALRQSMREKWELGRMEESIKHYKIELASKNKDINDRLQQVEESHSGQLMQYERKMSHLRKLLSQKQQALDDMAGSKKQIENELETVWQAAHSENKRIMESLHRSKVIL